jgi:hypothetical protein
VYWRVEICGIAVDGEDVGVGVFASFEVMNAEDGLEPGLGR